MISSERLEILFFSNNSRFSCNLDWFLKLFKILFMILFIIFWNIVCIWKFIINRLNLDECDKIEIDSNVIKIIDLNVVNTICLNIDKMSMKFVFADWKNESMNKSFFFDSIAIFFSSIYWWIVFFSSFSFLSTLSPNFF